MNRDQAFIAIIKFSALLLASTLLIGCSSKGDPNVSKVRQSITATQASAKDYKSGPLQGGTAVLVDGMAAYWVLNGTVYAANGHAKTWSPGVPYSDDPNVSFSDVERAVR